MRLGLDDSKIGALVGSNPEKCGPYMGGLERMGGLAISTMGQWLKEDSPYFRVEDVRDFLRGL